MKTFLAVGVAFGLAGCAGLPLIGGNSGPVVGIKSPSDADALTLTSRPAEEMATCIAGIVRASAQRDGDGYTITTTGARPVTYKVHSISDPRFTTEVDQFGQPAEGSPNVSACLVSGQTGM